MNQCEMFDKSAFDVKKLSKEIDYCRVETDNTSRRLDKAYSEISLMRVNKAEQTEFKFFVESANRQLQALQKPVFKPNLKKNFNLGAKKPENQSVPPSERVTGAIEKVVTVNKVANAFKEPKKKDKEYSSPSKTPESRRTPEKKKEQSTSQVVQ